MLPKIYEFPPFFTKQVNEDTWLAQKQHWFTVIVEWCRLNQRYEVTRTSPVFANERIHRTLPPAVAEELLNEMLKDKSAERLDGGAVHVYAKKPTELAADIRAWATSRGQSGTVVTLYELSNGEIPALAGGLELDELSLKRAAQLLEKQGYATTMTGEDGEIEGLKLA